MLVEVAVEDVRREIKRLKTGKELAVDGVTNEMPCQSGERLIWQLTMICKITPGSGRVTIFLFFPCQASSPLECDICCNVFSEDHCPRLLLCSHTVCGRCIDELISIQKKECPVCRTLFVAESAEDVVINRNLLDAAKQLASNHQESKASISAPKKSILEFTEDFWENIAGKYISDLLATEAELKNCISSYTKMKEGILKSNKGIARHIQMMKKMQLSNEKTLATIEQNIKEMNIRLDSMLQEKVKLCDVKTQLRAAPDFASAGAAIDEAGPILQGAEQRVNEIKQLLQENDKRRDDMRQDTLRITTNLTDAVKDLGRIIEELEGDTVIKITVTDLRSPHGRLRGDAQREIFAVMTFEGKLRLAPVKIESNNQVSFTHLEEGVLPPRCFVIELESLIPGGGSPSPPLSSPLPRGFLDLAYGPTPLGRVIIRVTVDGLQGRNFLLMCAGGIGGNSYAQSRVSGVEDWLGEWIIMGEYQPLGGGGGGSGTTSTRAVLPSREEDWKRELVVSGTYEETPWKAGDARGDISYEGASKFWIVTRDHPRWRHIYCFGMVEEGLDVLKSAISKYEDIEQVKVANCGLIL
ncbi:uncharacterized protein LOC135199009 [Macrobrachium nipponense]|uniref:uncharacterized protein LOC135199009 n=1 Tax=Macrobrachium nipponense TaxID=159736 RepID=UPI0030C8335C